MSIWRTYGCLIGSEDTVTDPPERVLGLMVVGGVAYVTINELGHKEEIGPDLFFFKMSARTLLHLLQASIAADEDEALTGTLNRLNGDLAQRLASAARPQDGQITRE